MNLVFVALPPDVRKACGLPLELSNWGCALGLVEGAQPQNFRWSPLGGAEPPPHIRRLSRFASIKTR